MMLEHYFLLFIIYSFFGWSIEMIYTIFFEHKCVNRGFLIGPYCPIYGAGALLIIFSLEEYSDSPVVLFVMAVVLCSILEYLTSYIMEKLFKTRWWDYNDRKFNINGRVCLENAAIFGLFGLILIYIVNPFFVKILSMLPLIIIDILFIIILLLFLLDFAVSFKIISNIKNMNLSMYKDSTEEITKIVKNKLLNNTILNRRIVKAFPKFKLSNAWIKENIENIRKKINKSE